MTDRDAELDLDDLSSAEDFLNYFGVPFEPAVVQVNRLHIMQRLHDYLAGEPALADEAPEARYRRLLSRAYRDFVDSDALTEKVFRVFRLHEPQEVFVPLDAIGRV